MNDPAYLRNLRAFSKRRWKDDDESLASYASLRTESDRGAIILASTVLEDMLEYRILSRMPTFITGEEGERCRKQIFETDGPLASFSRKIMMAYALGIIDQPYRKIIDLIREIRNACAHARHPVSLDTPEIRDACLRVTHDMQPALSDKSAETIRNAFIVKCSFVTHYVLTGEKIEGPDEQIRHFLKVLRDA